MITPEWARLMAAYGAEMNRRLHAAGSTLAEADRRAEAGAFFGSLHATLSHLLWADAMWLHRLAGSERPPGGIRESTSLHPDWEAMGRARGALDGRMRSWAASLAQDDLEGELRWFSGALGRDMARPRAVIVTHLFNHATHHRGQAHAILTRFGARPGDTDLPFIDLL